MAMIVLPFLAPARPDERSMVDRVALWVSLIRHKMSRDELAAALRDSLRAGNLSVTLKAIEAAEQHKDELADSVLRFTYAEMANRHEPMSQQLRAFGERAVLRPPVKRKPGAHGPYDDWLRNVHIALLVELACLDFGLHPQRNRAQRRARQPSGCSVVTAGLARNGIHLDERTVENITGSAVGVLVRQTALAPLYRKYLGSA
jgi:hypothetical protein